MADTKFSALPAASAAAFADEFAVNEAGTSKKLTLTQLATFLDLKGSNVASAAVVSLGDGAYFHITGTTTITDIDFATSWDGRRAILVFDGILTLTHNATTLILPGAQNIVTSPGDSCIVVVDSGDNVKVHGYQRALAVQNTNPYNASVADQTINAATSALLTGSLIAIPPSLLRIGSRFKWKMTVSKTAAGTAGNTFVFRLGTLGTVADAAILTFGPLTAGTGVVDRADVEINVTCRGPLSASGIFSGWLTLNHNLSITGFSTKQTEIVRAVSAATNVTTANLFASVSCLTAASTVLTFEQVVADSQNL